MDSGDLDSPDWWNAHVSRLPGPVIEVARIAHPDAVGATSAIEQVRLTCSGHQTSQLSVVVKHSLNAGSDSVLHYPQWRIERDFYQQAAQELPLRTLNCRYSWASNDGLAGLLVLDDVTHTQQATDPLTRELAQVAINALIPTQVVTWRTTAHRWAPRTGTLLAEAMPGIWRHLRDRARPEARSLYDLLLPRLPALASAVSGMDLCLIHGDCSPRNLLWSGDQVTFIDFGTARVDLGAIDISRIVASTPEFADTQTEHRRMCAYWQERLRAEGVVDFTPDQAWHSYRLGLALNALFGALMEVPPASNGPLTDSYCLGAELMFESLRACDIPSFVTECLG